MSYLVHSHREGDCGQGLEELWGPPGWILGVGSVHKAEELQHADGESPLPGAIFRTCRGLKAHFMRGSAGEHDWGCTGAKELEI